MPEPAAILSIITPVLNGDAYLTGCLENVCGQIRTPSGRLEVEHIIVDGGSSDRTLEIATSYALRFDHIKIISFPGSNQSEAMNRGIERSSGMAIGFLNVDDYYSAGTIQRVARLFEELDPNVFLVGNCMVHNESDQIWWVNRPRRLSLTRILLGPAVQEYPINPSAYFYHRAIHDVVGKYDVDDDFAMDLDMIIRILKFASVCYVDENWGHFRFVPGTKTFEADASGLMHEHTFNTLKKHRNQLSLPKRWFVKSASALLSTPIFRSGAYFWQRPIELIPRLSRRLSNWLRNVSR